MSKKEESFGHLQYSEEKVLNGGDVVQRGDKVSGMTLEKLTNKETFPSP